MSELFKSIKIRGLTIPNRLAVSPMCQYSSVDGFASDWHLVHLGSRAAGGAGLVMVEATAVTPEGRITLSDLGIWKDEHIAELERIAKFIHARGSIAGIQLAHAGRKASHDVPWKGGASLAEDEGAWEGLAPSAIPFKPEEPAPREMSLRDIENLIKAFRDASQRALNAGFKIVEIHAAHGYLLHEFLSPYSNKRTDQYGGDFDNRIRLLLQVIAAVRKVWPSEYPLFVRISATEWVDHGWNEDDSIELAKKLQAHEVDLVDCSTGGNIPGVRIPLVPLYQVSFAEKIKRESGMLTAAVGLINTAAEAESIIAEGRADMVFMGRQMLRDPYFPLHAAKELGVELRWPDQYLRAKS